MIDIRDVLNPLLSVDYQDGQQLQEWRKRLHHDKELCNAKRNILQLQKVFIYVLVDPALRCLTTGTSL